ncbi:NGG1p interacting factor NIF3 [Candidatus Omnitrophota bacterium]
MTLKDFYNFVVKEGINADPRGSAAVNKQLQRTKKILQQLNQRQKDQFDRERLTNPYSDTRVLCGPLTQKVKTILVGVDIASGELFLADKLRQQGQKIDLVVSHHPQGVGLAGLGEVMEIHAEILKNLGVPISTAEALMAVRIAEVKRRIMSANHRQTVDLAEHLKLPFICCHTVADNHVATYLQRLMDKQKPDTLQDAVDILTRIPEFSYAIKEKAGPRILVGAPKRQAGKIFVDMTGGTEGSKDIFQKLAQAGINTIVAMHLSEEHFRKVKSEHINVIIAGHIASDNLGLNLLLDKLEKKQKLSVIQCSGFQRRKRR